MSVSNRARRILDEVNLSTVKLGDAVQVKITGKKGKVVWRRKKIVPGIPSFVVEFEDGRKQEYTEDQFLKVLQVV